MYKNSSEYENRRLEIYSTMVEAWKVQSENVY
jgi:hypothetical protein